jgi:hypothetical protein
MAAVFDPRIMAWGEFTEILIWYRTKDGTVQRVNVGQGPSSCPRTLNFNPLYQSFEISWMTTDENQCLKEEIEVIFLKDVLGIVGFRYSEDSLEAYYREGLQEIWTWIVPPIDRVTLSEILELILPVLALRVS